jgi:hypothetical protein
MTTFCIAFYESYLSTPPPRPSNEEYPGPLSVKFNTNVYLLLRRRCPNTLNYHESMGYIPRAPLSHSSSSNIPSFTLPPHSVVFPPSTHSVLLPSFRHPPPILSSFPPAVICPICHPPPVPSSSSHSVILSHSVINSAILPPIRHSSFIPSSL